MLARILSEGWSEFYEIIKGNPEIEKLETQLDKCYNSSTPVAIEPTNKDDLLLSLRMTTIENVKVVILGNRPMEHSNGLTFGSYAKLKEFDKIKEEIDLELHEKISESNDEFTKRIAKQGVLMLDTCATSLMSGRTNAHGLLWTVFMEELVKYLYNRGHMVWLIWSQAGLKLVNSVTGADEDNGGNKKTDNDKRNVPTNIMLKCSYPTQSRKPNPEAIRTRKFEGCNHFLLCNHYLKQMFMTPIEWVKK